MSFALTTTYVLIHCFECGVGFAVAESFNNDLIKTRNTFYCPNGHRQAYCGKTEAQKVREQLDREREAHARTKRSLNAANSRTDAEKRSHAATKGKLTKQTNRIKAGVCPFCKRPFENLMRHMQTQHPDKKKSCHGS